jgi:hypothetical protein
MEELANYPYPPFFFSALLNTRGMTGGEGKLSWLLANKVTMT